MNRGLLPPTLAREGISPRDGGEHYNTKGYKFAVRLLKSKREADNGKGDRRGTREVKKNFKKMEKKIDLPPQQTNKQTNQQTLGETATTFQRCLALQQARRCLSTA